MKVLYRLAWLASRVICKIWLRSRIYHPERVPREGPVILASNHVSYLDPPFVGSSLPREIHYLAREDVFHYPIAGSLLRSLNAVPVNRDGSGAKGLKSILNRLLQGGGILIFPEGTRSRDGYLQPARDGIGLTIIKSSAPVVPVRIWGAFEAFGRNRWFPRPRRISVKFGEPLGFKSLREEAKTCPRPRLKEIYRQATGDLMAAIAALQDGPD